MTDEITPEDVKVRPQPTPNPHAVKFIINKPVKIEGKVSYRTAEEAKHVPLAMSVFDLDNISQVFLFQNTMTVTHNGDWENEELKSFIVPIIKAKLPLHDPSFKTADELLEEEKKANRKALSPELQEIEAILDRTIRPGLRADGGDIEVNDYNHPELYVTFQGACGSCPSSLMGTLQAIQGIMAQEFKEDIEVIPE